MRRMLAACEFSGLVRDAFAEQGWDAWSCDLEPSERPGQHLQMDVRSLFMFLREDWRYRDSQFDLIIAFPPCTDLSLAGANRWKEKRADGRQDRAAAFFMEMVRAPAPMVAVENPRGDMARRYRPPDQVVEPWWFGDPYSKKTCLWLKGLPPLAADRPVEPAGRIATGGGSWRTDKAAERKAMNAHEDGEGRVNRARVRSRTMPGLARAMAQQWSAL